MNRQQDDRQQDHELLWQRFQEQELLSDLVIEKYQRYVQLLLTWNSTMNLTAITDLRLIIRDHLHDSLFIDRFIDIPHLKTIGDVGTGAGFPALPLKIKYPHLSLVLLEVNHKKIQFLKTVIKELALSDVTLCPYDWRTFLRTTTYDIDLFVSRASLHTDELMRLFKPGCFYKQARLVYWASKEWVPTDKELPYIEAEYPYTLGHKKRRYVLFKLKTA